MDLAILGSILFIIGSIPLLLLLIDLIKAYRRTRKTRAENEEMRAEADAWTGILGFVTMLKTQGIYDTMPDDLKEEIGVMGAKAYLHVKDAIGTSGVNWAIGKFFNATKTGTKRRRDRSLIEE